MRYIYLSITMILMLGFASISLVSANTVTVTPLDLQGWVGATSNTPGASWQIKNIAPAGCPAGDGAFYATCGQYGSLDGELPGQSWIGTNAYAGIPISQITKLTYTTYTAAQGNNATHFASQPIQLQIACWKSPTELYGRYLIYRPWGLVSSEELHNPWGQWEAHDAIAGTSDKTHAGDAQGVWFEAWTDSSNLGITYTWAEVVKKWPDAVIQPASTPAIAWDSYPWITATGCGLNFEVGARKQTGKIFGLPIYAWWRESYNFAGFMDNFTIGINGVDTTYDFEGPVAPGTYAIGNKAAKSVAMNDAKEWHRFVIIGKVTLCIDADNFLVDDGSGVAVQVHAVNYNMYDCAEGNYIRALGTIDNTTTPATLNSASTAITALHKIEIID